MPKPFNYASASSLLNRQADSQTTSASNSAAYPHSHALPHHHHHHHHHLHPHPSAQPSTTPTSSTSGTPRDERSNPGTTAPTKQSPVSTPVTGTAPPPRSQPAGLGLSAGPTRPFGGGYGLFGGFREQELRERERLERERQREREREREAKAVASGVNQSPNRQSINTGVSSSYPRPSLPPSPTNSRAAPTPTSAQPTSTSNKPSLSPQMPTASTASTPRPNLPLPNFSSLGSRSLPSPFENGRERSHSVKQAEPPSSAHQRTLSNTSARGDAGMPNLLGTIQTSPGKAPPQPSSSRSIFGGTPIAQTPRDRNVPQSPVSRAPSTADPAVSPKTVQIPTNSAGYSFPAAAYARTSTYSNNYMGFAGGFGYGTFGSSWADRERSREKERERERERQREVERRKLEEREIERRRAEEKEKAALVETKPFQTPRQATAFSDPYHRGSSRIEVLNQPEQTAQYPSGGEPSVIQQVAPQREPRPYTYSAKPEPQSQRDREYSYTPREKRPRMDAAVEESAHRRGSVSKSKRKREEEKVKSPVQPVPLRDFSVLTKEVKRWPEVMSSPVEAWLKSIPDLGVVIANEVYDGSDWTLVKTRATKADCEGGVVNVRINGAFLGDGWVIRGEKAWDEATPTPPGNVELARGIDIRRVWGTDVYTDDSDLGLVLIHAGWVRWVPNTPKEATDHDVVYVTVRIVPRLVRYTATERNGVRTRGWGNGHDGLSIVVEGVSRTSVCDEILLG